MRKLAPEIRRSALIVATTKDFVQVARSRSKHHFAQYMLVTPERVKVAHEAGLQVIPWTRDEPAVWKRLVDAGVGCDYLGRSAALNRRT